MFPSSSYNTPHGYQFGREAYLFNEEAVNPNLRDEALSERQFEQTEDTRAQVVQAERERAYQVAEQSRVEANVIALPVERTISREQSVREVRDIHHVGYLFRSMRNEEKAA